MLRVSGTKIAKLLAREGWSQSILAIKSRVDKNTISKIVQGGDQGSLRNEGTVGALAHTFGIDVDDVLVDTYPSATPLTLSGLSVSGMQRLLSRCTPLPSHFYLPPFDDAEFRSSVIEGFSCEAIEMLQRTNIFDVRNLQQRLTAREDSPGSSERLGQLRSLVETTIRSRAPLTSKSALSATRPLAIHLVPSLLGTVLVFEHIRVVQGVDLTIEYVDGLSAAPLRRRMDEDDEVDIAALPLVSASRFLDKGGDCQYRLMMTLPRTTHRIVGTSPSEAGSQTSGVTFLLLGEVGATAKSYLLELAQLGLLDLNCIKEIACDSARCEATMAAAAGDLRAVLYFPFSVVFSLRYGLPYVDDSDLEATSKEAYLFASKRLCQNEPLIREIAHRVQFAIESLRQNEDLVRALVEMLFQDDAFMRSVSSGFDRNSSGPSLDKGRKPR